MDPREYRHRSQALLFALALIGAALAMALPASAGAAPPAHAARYTYELCDSALPGGNPPAVRFVVNHPSDPFGLGQTCASSGGSVYVQQWGNVSSTNEAFAVVSIPAPPGGSTELTNVSGGACGGGATVAFFSARGWPNLFCHEETRLYAGGGENWLWLGCESSCAAGPIVWVHDIAATEADPKAPTLTGIQGSLLGGGAIRGHQTIGTEAHDVGGGLTNLSISVNGQPAGSPKTLACNTTHVSNPSVVGTVALALTPCPTAAKESWTLNTEAPPFREGANAVQVCASDFATIGEPNTTCSAAQTVNVDNSCTNSPVAGGELLSAQFTKSNNETLTVGFGKEAEVVGTLRTNSGDPVAGATLCVKMQTLEVDAQASPVGTVTTDGNGNYSYKVPAGPNRDVVIGYRHDTAQVARDVRYYAHARPSLHASSDHLHNGERVKFWGQLQGPHRRGRVVILQANVLGSKRWITFRKATSAEKGIFRAKYHFTSTTRKTTYRFRAVVPDQAGYPWVQGHSKPVRVRVAP
jgi:hypothetical protein